MGAVLAAVSLGHVFVLVFEVDSPYPPLPPLRLNNNVWPPILLYGWGHRQPDVIVMRNVCK